MNSKTNSIRDKSCSFFHTVRFTVWGAAIFFICANAALARQSVQHIPPSYIEKYAGQTLLFEFVGSQAAGYSEAILFYRTDADSRYNQKRSGISNQETEFIISIDDENATVLEYYVVLQSASGSELTYPNVEAEAPPLRLQIIDRDILDAEQSDFIDVAVLSPGEGEIISGDDFIYAAALFYDASDIEGGTFSLYLNGENVSEEAEITPYLIKYLPRDEALKGEQNVQIRFGRGESEYLVSSHTFSLAGNAQVTAPGQRAAAGAFEKPGGIPRGTLEVSARNQQISGYNNDVLDARLRLSGAYGEWGYSFSGFLTTQESSRLQPQNRYSGQLEYSDWFTLQAGDVYPYLGDLTVSGRKVRGFSSQIVTPDENFELQVVHGQLRRQIRNLYNHVQFTEQTVSEQVVDTLYTLSLRDGGLGAFRQRITGARAAVGNRERFQFGLFGMKVRDDTTSTNPIRDFRDVMAVQPELATALRPADIQSLEQNPERLQVNGLNIKPRDNIVFGTDFTMGFDSQRIRLHTEVAAGLLNNDITGGALNQQRADELGLDLDSNYEDFISQISWLIIINENMSSLPFGFTETETGNSEVNPFFPASILAGRSELNANYAGQNIQVKYRWIGPDYHSLANRTLLRDLSGITVTDRMRLYENRIFLTVGFESLRNNVMNTSDATLRTNTARSSFSYFPVQQNLPDVTLSLRFRTRQNGVSRFNPYVDQTELNSAVRNFAISNGDTLLVSRPQNNQTLTLGTSINQDFSILGGTHQANATYSHTYTKDDVFEFGDSKNHSFGFRIINRYDGKPFRTRIGWNSTILESSGGQNEAKIHAITAGGDWFLLDNNLILNGDLSIASNFFRNRNLIINDNNTPEIFFDNTYEADTLNPAVERSTRVYSLRVSAAYDFLNDHTVEAFLNITNLQNRLDNGVYLPNDRILQMRYRFRF